MSEEKKDIELKDEDLKRVTGGAEVSIKSINKGDYFQKITDQGVHYIARQDYTEIQKDTYMSFDMYVDGAFYISYNNVVLQELQSSYYYVPPMSDPNYVPHS